MFKFSWSYNIAKNEAPTMLQSYSINYYVCYMVYILLSKLNRGLCTLIDLLVPDSKGSSYRYCLLGD